jgi:hypothetical protein
MAKSRASWKKGSEVSEDARPIPKDQREPSREVEEGQRDSIVVCDRYMMGPGVGGQEGQLQQQHAGIGGGSGKRTACKCGSNKHMRITHKECPNSPKNKAKVAGKTSWGSDDAGIT